MDFVKFLGYMSKSLFSIFAVVVLIASGIYSFTHFSIWANHHTAILKGLLVLFFVIIFSYMAVVYADPTLSAEEKRKKLGG